MCTEWVDTEVFLGINKTDGPEGGMVVECPPVRPYNMELKTKVGPYARMDLGHSG